jgi:Zinc-binding dehydrogenase
MLIAHRAVPHIGATFDLTETAAALRHVADGKAIGKVVLFVNRTINRVDVARPHAPRTVRPYK